MKLVIKFGVLAICFLAALGMYHILPSAQTETIPSKPIQLTVNPVPKTTAVFPTAAEREFEETVGTRPPTNSTFKGHFKDFGFEGACFRFKAGEVCGGESNILHFKAINGAVWATDWHYNYKGKDHLYAARVKETKPCGPYLPDFEEIPSQCIAEEVIVPATQARAWLKKQFGPKLYGDPDTQAALDRDYPIK